MIAAVSENSAMSFAHMPIKKKLRLAIIGTTIFTIFLVIAAYIAFEWFSSRQQLAEDLEVRADIISSNSTAALAFYDQAAADETLQALKASPDIRVACIYSIDQPDSLFARYSSSSDAAAQCPATQFSEFKRSTLESISLNRPIILEGETLGYIYIESNLNQVWQRIRTVLQVACVVLLGSSFIAFLLAELMQRVILLPIMKLAGTAKQVSESRDYSIRADKFSEDETGELIDVFNGMLEQISKRDVQLEEARDDLEKQVHERTQTNAELQKTLLQLQETQDQLVQTEKMASLGGLVAGVSHEINTPVGVGVTAASTLVAKSQELQEIYSSGKINRSSLDEYISSSNELSAIILTNLERAATLIQSFKQVAVDQSSSEKRNFLLNEYIEEIMLSLRPRLKKTAIQVDVDCPVSINMESYPGALSQILTNLVMNSLHHAFEDDQDGSIAINVVQEGDMVNIAYADDGKGIPAQNFDKIFDPFFTTSRGQGGSGLGMHIVFNLVSQTLKGTIRLDRTVKKGARFEIRIPQKVKI